MKKIPLIRLAAALIIIIGGIIIIFGPGGDTPPRNCTVCRFQLFLNIAEVVLGAAILVLPAGLREREQ